jgi:hypothetical protein
MLAPLLSIQATQRPDRLQTPVTRHSQPARSSEKTTNYRKDGCSRTTISGCRDLAADAPYDPRMDTQQIVEELEAEIARPKLVLRKSPERQRKPNATRNECRPSCEQYSHDFWLIRPPVWGTLSGLSRALTGFRRIVFFCCHPTLVRALPG